MRIVATSDTHFPFPTDRIPDGDVFIHAGDLMYSGYPDEWYKRLQSLKDLPHKRKLFVPGNHDLHMEIYAGPAMQELRDIGVEVVGHPSQKKKITQLKGGLTVLGLPFVTELPRWAFNRTEPQLFEYLETMPRADIVVSHSPPSGTLDGLMVLGKFTHIGVYAYKIYLLEQKPMIWICGHCHERYGFMKTENTDIYNVAMCNEAYQQVNPPVVIDL